MNSVLMYKFKKCKLGLQDGLFLPNLCVGGVGWRGAVGGAVPWVFIAVCGLSLVPASRNYSWFQCEGFYCDGFSCCWAQALGR